MQFLKRTKTEGHEETNHHETSTDNNNNHIAHYEQPKATFKAITLGICASMGGMVFGYESGQISGTWWFLIVRIPTLTIVQGL